MLTLAGGTHLGITLHVHSYLHYLGAAELEVADSGAHEVLLELRCSPRGVWFSCHGGEAALFHRALTSSAGSAQQVCYENRPW